MSIIVQWDNDEKTIVRQEYQGVWTWDDYFTALHESDELVASVEHCVDVIVNMRPGILPKNGAAMSNARSAMRSGPPNRGLVVIVTNPFIRALLNVFLKIDRQFAPMVAGVDSIEQARALIAQRAAERVKT
jgi:hypothetical protein